MVQMSRHCHCLGPDGKPQPQPPRRHATATSASLPRSHAQPHQRPHLRERLAVARGRAVAAAEADPGWLPGTQRLQQLSDGLGLFQAGDCLKAQQVHLRGRERTAQGG